MKPKYYCPKCGVEIQFWQEYCDKCTLDENEQIRQRDKARVIAEASRDMLDTLKNIANVCFFVKGESIEKISEGLQHIIGLAEATISKAEGRYSSDIKSNC